MRDTVGALMITNCGSICLIWLRYQIPLFDLKMILVLI